MLTGRGELQQHRLLLDFFVPFCCYCCTFANFAFVFAIGRW